MICFENTGEAAEIDPEWLRALKTEISELEGRAEELRDDASDLERQARQLRRGLEGGADAYLQPATVAAWMLRRDELHLGAAARATLEAAVMSNDLARLRAVATLYQVVLPAELYATVPRREQIARARPLDGLPLFAPKGEEVER